MILTEVTEKLASLLASNGAFADIIESKIDRVATMIQSEYKKQIPVDGGDARKDVQIIKDGRFNRVITSLTTNHGVRYPVLLYEGTGKFRGSSFDFNAGNQIRPGFTRNANYTEDEIIMFKAIAKRGGQLSIPPNKFPDRTVAEVSPKVNTYLEEQIDKLTKE